LTAGSDGRTYFQYRHCTAAMPKNTAAPNNQLTSTTLMPA
jgi:hypothetical protein